MSNGSPDTAALQRILRETRTIAVVGASDNPARQAIGLLAYGHYW